MMRNLLFCCFLLLSANAFSQSADSVYTVVDTPAEFPGGQTAMANWLRTNFHYQIIPESDPVGRTYISFIVETDGKLSNVRVSSPSPELTSYLGGLVLSMPKWQPALLNGQPVRTAFRLPLTICF